MTRNVTLRVEESLIRRCRRRAAAEDKSLSRWVGDLMKKSAGDQDVSYEEAKKKALAYLKEGFHLGGAPFRREDAYDRHPRLP